MSSTAARPNFLPFSPPVYSAGYPQRRQPPPSLSFPKVLENSLLTGVAFHAGGLQTPPADDTMSMAYPNPVLSNSYESHVALARQPPNTLAPPVRNGPVLCSSFTQYSRVPQQVPQQRQQQPQQSQYQQPSHHPYVSQPRSVVAPPRYSPRPSTPPSAASSTVPSEGTVSKADSSMVMHSLQLPTCISANGGSLDEFAALVGDLLKICKASLGRRNW